jgi:hypothetical protein
VDNSDLSSILATFEALGPYSAFSSILDKLDEQAEYEKILEAADLLELVPAPEILLLTAVRRARALQCLGRCELAMTAWHQVRARTAASNPAQLSEADDAEIELRLALQDYPGAIAAFQSRQPPQHQPNRERTLTTFKLEVMLIAQLREIADGILADMLIRPDLYESIWSFYDEDHIWWSYFCNSRGASPRASPESLKSDIMEFQSAFSSAIASGTITPNAPAELTVKHLDVLGRAVPFINFRETNELLANLGSAKRLVVQDMRDHAERPGSKICEFLFGDVESTTYPEFDFTFQKEDVVSPTMVFTIAGLNGGHATDSGWIVVRKSSAQARAQRIVAAMAAGMTPDEFYGRKPR